MSETSSNAIPAYLPLRNDLIGEEPYGAPQLDVPVCLNVNENPYAPEPAVVETIAQRVKEIIDSGEIGRIRYLESKHSTFDTNREGIRYQKGVGGGAVYDVTCAQPGGYLHTVGGGTVFICPFRYVRHRHSPRHLVIF